MKSKTTIFITLFAGITTLFFAVVGKHTPQSDRALYIQSYSSEENRRIGYDLTNIRQLVFADAVAPKERAPIYLATVGGPGSRKSTNLEEWLEKNPSYKKGVYIDPDQRVLKFMINTYHAISLNAKELAKDLDLRIRQRAYEKWRAASNHIVNRLFEEAVAGRYDIIHGTTSTGAHVPAMHKKLRETGYQLHLMLCFADEEYRFSAIDYRNLVQKFYQSTPEDGIAKGMLFYPRIAHCCRTGDRVLFMWTPTFLQQGRCVAEIVDGKLQVYCEKGFNAVRKLYAKHCDLLEKKGVVTEPWESFIPDRKRRDSNPRIP